MCACHRGDPFFQSWKGMKLVNPILWEINQHTPLCQILYWLCRLPQANFTEWHCLAHHQFPPHSRVPVPSSRVILDNIRVHFYPKKWKKIKYEPFEGIWRKTDSVLWVEASILIYDSIILKWDWCINWIPLEYPLDGLLQNIHHLQRNVSYSEIENSF